MSETYFDAVLDQNYYPHFNGTREETLAFLKADGIDPTKYTVCLGENLAVMSGAAYLRAFDKENPDEVHNEA